MTLYLLELSTDVISQWKITKVFTKLICVWKGDILYPPLYFATAVARLM